MCIPLRKLVVVAPADTKIGGEVVKALLLSGMEVIGLGIRLALMEMMRSQLPLSYRKKFHTRSCEFNSMNSVKTVNYWIQMKFGEVQLAIFIVPRVTDEHKALYANGNEFRLQKMLDASENSADAYLELASRMIVRADHQCGRLWKVKYNLDLESDEVDEDVCNDVVRKILLRLQHLEMK